MSRKRLNGSDNESISPWALTTDQVVKALGTDVNKGLSPAQVQALHERYGFNELVKQPGKPLWKLVLEQFDDMLVKVRTEALFKTLAPHNPSRRSCCSQQSSPLSSRISKRRRVTRTLDCVHTLSPW